MAKCFKRSLLMTYFPNGDPWLRGTIEVWLPVGTAVDRPALVKAISGSLYQAMMNEKVPIIKRNRWRGLCNGLGGFGVFLFGYATVVAFVAPLILLWLIPR